MSKLDLRKELKELYTASAKKPAIIKVPKLKYLMVDGMGDPNDNPAFQQSIEALYGLSYTMKFASKLGPDGQDWTVMPLDGLWWVEGKPFSETNKNEWRWTLMIAQPDFVSAAMFRAARKQLKQKKDSALIDSVRLGSLREGISAQIMHTGPYAEEGPTIERLHQFAVEQGYEFDGKHHEIYMSDPRRTAPEKLKTIVRYPVKKQ